MRIKIWGQEETPEPVLNLRLIEGPGNSVEAATVDSDGCRLSGGTLVIFRPEGVKRLECVSPKIGFPLDGRGRIIDL